ncbi:MULTISPECIES: cytochrome c oxidase assembly protein [unclassified Colwellia]|jgi:cytochrome c oxidase assembly protein subunit 11|uniref:cytochrome c oxidase assembly protein n=1 Tax=unclassified Colwellia TaxID=196834 RepID=UPI0015F53C4A|nr:MULTISPECIES: cytochrome c oxidase assembly protein [unclassified Colwellia]MBA6348548.1 cytochrome c oxidase assembly protein [Colwellia sp. BRX8-9]MBA6352394.1 cytochrome c oxidase assembly protein [Colwellia sp. BRX9-1]MBA6355165.1 cytochrome c oxidase assembly protein [Colwellia sp. BRX8-3]MBA6361197.1 cytochrome c oxidase assembly protein [Colwellia sp. BRX8-6]MBA6362430.1 cytochrome c oxidase assembly protein [Colwellia sp. BRX8-8]MBA6366311.1 cytochrome c oxidase assembly protein [C|tara:strand:- start:150 stop:731 length:582 start_codon:yes stop_codon:yes gene_type:complete
MNKGDELQNSNNKDSTAITKNNQVIKKLVMIVFGMFGFGFALVPLYDVFCDITGLNGKTSTTAAAVYNVEQIDTKRIVTVQFISRTAQGIPWQFEPMVREIKVHPGEMKLVKFYAKNESTRDIIGQAVPSVSPGLAAAYFQKIECFCFTQQPLKANEEVEMALQFYVDPELPEDISTLTLSYTLYDVTGKVES